MQSLLRLKATSYHETLRHQKESQVEWHTPVTPALGRKGQEDYKFEAKLDYIVSFRSVWANRHCLKKKIKKKVTYSQHAMAQGKHSQSKREKHWHRKEGWGQNKTKPSKANIKYYSFL
jgi:Zn-finger nucleic acid-binding protein